eukprot:60975-Amphidinium_carterae.2
MQLYTRFLQLLAGDDSHGRWPLPTSKVYGRWASAAANTPMGITPLWPLLGLACIPTYSTQRKCLSGSHVK